MFAFDVRGTQVTLHQDPANTATTGTKVWEAVRGFAAKKSVILSHLPQAQVLAQYCVVNARKLRFGPGKRCLELGSGCGLVGFTLAILGCEVTLSDQAAGLYLLKKNADLNSQICHVATVALDWNEELPDSIRSRSPFDVVVGSDVGTLRCQLHSVQLSRAWLQCTRRTLLLRWYERSMLCLDPLQ